MDYSRPDLVDALAAAYAAGTLRGAARRRFEVLLPAHPALREASRAWQQRLMPLTTVMAPEAPPPHVWQRIEARLDGERASTATPIPEPRRGFASRLGFWRTLAGFASIAAISLAVLLARPTAVPPPVVVVLSSTAPATGGAVPATFVASISGDGRAVVTRPVTTVSVQADRALELWAVPPAGGAPRSLGLISASGATVVRNAKTLEGAEALAVSLEPPGGSPTGAPTGAVLYAGKVR